MEIALIGSAFLLGLVSSAHCIGMCGPIALSLGISGKNTQFHIQNLAYQIGRAVTYTFLGSIIGLFTEALILLQYQDYISIVAGVLILLFLLFPTTSQTYFQKFAFFRKIIQPIKKGLGNFLQKKGIWVRFITGILNGFLPCGPVYIALAASIAAGGSWQSAIFMFFYGLGTLPLMYIMVYLGNSLSLTTRNKMNRFLPYITALIAVFFILRGLHLGIPFLSPPKENLNKKIELIHSTDSEQIKKAKPSCCEK